MRTRSKSVTIVSILLSQNNASNSVTDISNYFSIPKTAIWHFRFSHVSSEKLTTLCKDFPSIHVNKEEVCGICHFAKQRRLPYTVSTNKASGPFELLHMDIWGPYALPLIHKQRYFLTIVDDFGRYTWVTLLKGKHQVQSLVQSFMALVARQFNASAKLIRTNNGPKFTLNSYYANKGSFIKPVV